MSDSNAGRKCKCCDYGDGGGVDGNDGGVMSFVRIVMIVEFTRE